MDVSLFCFFRDRIMFSSCRYPLHQAVACSEGRLDDVQVLLTDKDTHINHADEHGITPLFFACQAGCVKVVIALLARKETQINQANNKGGTPLLMACEKGHVKVVNVLLARKEIHVFFNLKLWLFFNMPTKNCEF